MNRFASKFVFVLTAFLLMVGHVDAQFTTTFAKNVTPGQQNGIYYSLPQTMLKLDFVIEETQLERSPLSDYASNYMSMADYVEYETTEYRILDVKLSTVATPDPNALFFVTFASVRGGNKVQFNMLPNGIIHSVGYGNFTVEEVDEVVGNETVVESEFPSNAGLLNLVTSGKSNSQLAKEVADKIEEIQKAKYKLVSGFYEVAFNPETFDLMYKKLEAMEKEYTNLLLGNRVTRKVVKSVYVIPNKEVPTQTVAKFSEFEGLTLGTSGSGDPISVQTLSLNTTAAINAPSTSAVESMIYENKVFYRIPEMANVLVTCGNKTLIEDRLIVNQLGAMLMAPLTNSELVFDTTTGQIVNLKMQ